MFARLALFAVALSIGPPDQRPLPSLDVVQNALKQNADRIANRRVKLVQIILPGPPLPQGPPLDTTEREEIEQLFAADGRWREKKTTFRAGKPTRTVDRAFLAGKVMKLETTFNEGKTHHYATKDESENANRDKPGGYFSEGLHQWFRLRTTLSWAPSERPLLALNLSADDRAKFQNFHLLDPAKNYWPVGAYSELLNDDGKRTKAGETTVEFSTGAGPLYPKRSSFLLSRGREEGKLETIYDIVASAEFPKHIPDDEFVVKIPDGVKVYFPGQSSDPDVPQPFVPSAMDTRMPFEVKFIYFCFLLIAAGLVAAARYLYFSDRSPPR